MGTGKTGGANAALLALQILAVKNADLRRRLVDEKARLAAQVEADSEKVRRDL
jgi:phosphoribosylcarboxyaminoimidazole (NCAIR) mutase